MHKLTDAPLLAAGNRILRYATVASTNKLAVALREDGAVIVAEAQTAGRGRHGRHWDSKAGLGLWFSMCVEGPPKGLVFAAALAVRDALRPKIEPAVKWPNDILYHGRKICGILIEHRGGWNAVGIGLNVRHQPHDFPNELRVTAGSLEALSGEPWDMEFLLDSIVLKLNENIAQLRAGNCAALFGEWSRACNLDGQQVTCGDISGRVVGIDETGALQLQTEAGLRLLHAGEIRLARAEA